MSHRKEVTCTDSFDNLPQFLTIDQVARYTQQSYWAVQQAVKKGRIPCERRFGRKLILIPKEFFRVRVDETVSR